MSAQAKRNDRSHQLWLLAYTALTFATLSGLFAMHGLPMRMPGAGTWRPAAMSGATADMAPSDALAATTPPPATGRFDRPRRATPASVRRTGQT